MREKGSGREREGKWERVRERERKWERDEEIGREVKTER